MELENKVILSDLEECTRINFLETLKSIEHAQGIEGFRCLISEPKRFALQKMVRNLKKVYNKYLIYLPEIHKEPINVYKNLKDNGEEFKSDLTQGLVCEVEDCPGTFEVYYALTQGFKDLPDKLLKLAAVHKFDHDFILEEMFGEDDNPEGEI